MKRPLIAALVCVWGAERKRRIQLEEELRRRAVRPVAPPQPTTSEQGDQPKPKASHAATKGAATRKTKAQEALAKRSEAAKKGARTRKRNQAKGNT